MGIHTTLSPLTSSPDRTIALMNLQHIRLFLARRDWRLEFR